MFFFWGPFQTRVAYVNYMTKIGKLLGSPDSNQTKEQMEKVLELEGKLAQVRLSP